MNGSSPSSRDHGPLFEQEVAEARLSGGRLVALQLQQHRRTARPDLAQEEAIDDTARFDQVGECGALAHWQW